MSITVLVVQHGALLDRLLSNGQIDPDFAVCIGLRALHRQLQGIEQAAGITVGDVHEMFSGIPIHLHHA